MCVIAFSPKGNEAPTEKQIKEMFKKSAEIGMLHIKF